MKEITEKERKVMQELRMKEFTLNLKERFHAIMLRDPRNMQEIAREMEVSRDLIVSFITGARKTSYKSLCVLEDWIAKEEKRLSIC
jgi:hypothetical protein